MATQPRTTKRSNTPDPNQEKRQQQLQEVETRIQSLNEMIESTRKIRSQVVLLENVSLGLYDEVDKLAKKAPAETVTDLSLESVNDVIRETKEVANQDSYVNRLKEFVAAGDNPQLRDVIIVLRQVRDGLKRFRESMDNKVTHAHHILPELYFLQAALEAYKEHGAYVEKDTLEDWIIDLPVQISSYVTDRWFTSTYPKTFKFDRLDRMNITDHFSE